MAHANLPKTGIDTTLLVPKISTAPDGVAFKSTAQFEEDERREREVKAAAQAKEIARKESERNELRNIPGTRAQREQEVANAQQGFVDNFIDGVKEFTAVAPIVRRFQDEGIDLWGWREKEDGYNKDEFVNNSDPRLDRWQMTDIIDEPNEAAAMRAHQRYVDELDRQERMAVQSNGSGLASMIGAFIDVDAPLFLMSAGAFGAAKLTAKTIKISQRAGLTFGAGERLASVTAGINAGLQGGVVVGVGEFTTKETATWENLAAILMASTVLGGSLGGLTNMNKHLHAKVAEEEFLGRIRRDEANLRETPDIDNMLNPNEVVDVDTPNLFTQVADGADDTPVTNVFSDPDNPGATIIGGEKPESLGAAAVGTGGRPQRVLDDPMGPIPEDQARWIDETDRIRYDSGFLEKRQENARKAWTKLAHSRLGRFSVDNFVKLYESQSSVLNFMSSHIFESSSGIGRGRATASVIMDNYHRRIQTHIDGLELQPYYSAWAKEQDATFLRSGYNISEAGRRAFDRELMLEMSDRSLGKTSNRSEHVKGAAEQYNAAGKEAYRVGQGWPGEKSVDGFDGPAAREFYNPYRWDGGAIQAMIRSGVKMADIEDAMVAAYRAAGMDHGKDAIKVAKATVHRAIARDADMDGSMRTLLSGDGRAFIAESLRITGVSETEIEAILGRLVGKAEDRAREGFAKGRNDLDLSTTIRNDAGEDLRIVDMMEKDMHRTWQRYSRQMSGAAALARQGITNRAQRTTMIEAARAEQRALGEEPMSAELLQAMLSHFNGGPTHGFFRGEMNVGVGQVVAIGKRLANLGLLEKLGLTQLSELGAVIAQVGMENFWRRGVMIAFDKEMRMANKKLLNDVKYVTGRIGKDHRYFAEWFDLDDVARGQVDDMLTKFSKWTSNASFIQSYISAFNHVRTYQQQVAVTGMIDKVMRKLKNGDYEEVLERFESDFGLGRAELDYIQGLVDDGTVVFHADGFVDVLNMDKWNPQQREVFGAAMARNMNQTVQKSLAGEQDAWMATGWGSLMTHLLTFPMQAFQKQFVRNGRHMDMQGFAALSFGLATAMTAVQIRDQISGRERSTEDRARQAFSYNNMTGWIPLVVDPAATILGMDNYRINPFGHHQSVVPPAISQFDALRRAPGALLTAAAGEPDYYDMQALKALPYAGVYFADRLWNGSSKKDTSKKDTPSRPSGLSSILNNPDVAAAIKAADGG